MRVANRNVTIAFRISVVLQIACGSFNVDSSLRMIAVLDDLVALRRVSIGGLGV